jgi:hypothetical protein
MSATVAELLATAAHLEALTLHQPWAWAVAEAGKDVENRKWQPPAGALGKPLAIHAGLTYDVPGAASIREATGLNPPGRHTCATGRVVAVALLVRARKDSPSRWAIPGAVHWCLEGVLRLPKPVECKGAQGLWRLSPTLVEEVRRQVLEATEWREAQARASVALSPTEGPPTGFEKVAAEAWSASVRDWSKGSARGAGPARQVGVVYVQRNAAAVVVCPKCRSSRYAGEGPHAARIMRNPPEGWPTCEHGYPVLADCEWKPTALTMCAWHSKAGEP